jgi:hypothetical protein
MKKFNAVAMAIFLSLFITASFASSPEYKKGEADAQKPVNCATAEADIRALESEKAHVADQMKAGVTAMTPFGMILADLSGTEGEIASVATGDYNKMLDAKIAEIKQKCGVK